MVLAGTVSVVPTNAVVTVAVPLTNNLAATNAGPVIQGLERASGASISDRTAAHCLFVHEMHGKAAENRYPTSPGTFLRR